MALSKLFLFLFPFPFPFFLLFFLQLSTNGENCPLVFCGDVMVDFPFRLRDQPECCGNPNFNLSCINQAQTIITFSFTGEFSVEIIGYSTTNLLISDQGNCIPKRSFRDSIYLALLLSHNTLKTTSFSTVPPIYQ